VFGKTNGKKWGQFGFKYRPCSSGSGPEGGTQHRRQFTYEKVKRQGGERGKKTALRSGLEYVR